MDRLETRDINTKAIIDKSIYIPVWIDQKPIQFRFFYRLFAYLYSSMDRLETFTYTNEHVPLVKFIFQYGQIRNDLHTIFQNYNYYIYIPVWIDQKLVSLIKLLIQLKNLYSSMDRLETSKQVIY